MLKFLAFIILVFYLKSMNYLTIASEVIVTAGNSNKRNISNLPLNLNSNVTEEEVGQHPPLWSIIDRTHRLTSNYIKMQQNNILKTLIQFEQQLKDNDSRIIDVETSPTLPIPASPPIKTLEYNLIDNEESNANAKTDRTIPIDSLKCQKCLTQIAQTQQSSSSAGTISASKPSVRISEEQLTELRIEFVKNQILQKLRLKERPRVSFGHLPRPIYEGLTMFAERGSQTKDLDDYYARTKQKFIFLEQEHHECDRVGQKHPSMCFTFKIDDDVDSMDVSTAQLWIYKHPRAKKSSHTIKTNQSREHHSHHHQHHHRHHPLHHQHPRNSTYRTEQNQSDQLPIDVRHFETNSIDEMQAASEESPFRQQQGEKGDEKITKETFVVSELEKGPHSDKYLPKAKPIAILTTEIEEGWIKIDIAWPIKKWYGNHELNHIIHIACQSCDPLTDEITTKLQTTAGPQSANREDDDAIAATTTSAEGDETLLLRQSTSQSQQRRDRLSSSRSKLSLLSTEKDYRPFIVIDTLNRRTNNRRNKRSVNCSDGITECCREKLYISFEEIGWNDWIIHPAGYNAYFCRGSCSSAATITLSNSHYTSVLRKVFYQRESNGAKPLELIPCCAATQFSSLDLLYLNSNETATKKKLPNMVVETCGCM